MSFTRWSQVEELFHKISELPPQQRRRALERRTLEDLELRTEVESLLEHDHGADAFLDEPALGRGFDAAAPQVTADELPGSLAQPEIDGYRLLRQIGHGGMGTVYLAVGKNDPTRRSVAIKLLRYGAQSEHLCRRFNRERQTLASLDHPHIARWLDGGAASGPALFGPYFVMEYIEGQPIDRYCDEHKLLITDRIKLFRQVCSAVQYAHQNLVVHRDLKPGNILVTPDRLPKLLDFGISKVLSTERTEGTQRESQAMTLPEARLLTPEYASPEQVRGERISTASDVYSLGVVLYELLTGRRPYRVRTHAPGEMERTICEHEPERPSTAVIRGDDPQQLAVSHLGYRTPEGIGAARGNTPQQLARRLRGDLDNIVLTALRKEPRRRYASVEQLSEDLRRYLDGLPITARKDTLSYRAAKFVIRNRAAVVAASLVMLSLVGGVIGTTWQAHVARSQRDLAQANLVLADQFKSAALGATARARGQAASARSVSDFLVGLFEMADPDHGLGKDVSAREILDRGAARLSRALVEQVEIRSELLDTIGMAYMNLGIYDRASELFEEAVKLRRERFGSRSPETAESLTSLGEWCRHTGKFERAMSLHSEALDFYKSRFGPDHVEIARSLSNIGLCVLEKGDPSAAEPYVADGLAMLKRLEDPDPPLEATLLANLAAIKFGKGDFAGAEPLLAESLELRRSLYGDEHPNVAIALHDLATARQFIGRPVEAELFFREALAIRRKLLGDDHMLVAVTLNGLGRLLVDRGAYAEAESSFREALAIARSRPGDDDNTVATALRYLALVLLDLGNVEEAETFAREALDVRRKFYGEQHPNVSTAMCQLARVLLVRGKALAAERLLRDALVMQRKLLGERHPDQIGSLRILGRTLLEQGDAAAAEQNLREALALADGLFGRSHVAAALVLGDLADALQERGERDEPERNFREALDIQRQLPSNPHADLAATLTRLGTLLVNAGQAPDAEPLLREAVGMYAALLPAGNWQTAWSENSLGACLTALGRYADAEPLLTASYPIIQTTHGPNARRTVESRRRVLKLYEAWNRPDKLAGLDSEQLSD